MTFEPFEPFDPLAEGIQREKALLAAGRASQQLEAMGIDPIKAFERLPWLINKGVSNEEGVERYATDRATLRTYLQSIQRGE